MPSLGGGGPAGGSDIGGGSAGSHGTGYGGGGDTSSSQGRSFDAIDSIGKAVMGYLGLMPGNQTIPNSANRVASGDPTSMGYGGTDEGRNATISEGLSIAAKNQDRALADEVFNSLGALDRISKYHEYTRKNTPKALSMAWNAVVPSFASMGIIQGLASVLNGLAGVPPGFHIDHYNKNQSGADSLIPNSSEISDNDLSLIAENTKDETGQSGGIPSKILEQIKYIREL